MAQILDHDPLSGMTVTMDYNHSTDELIIKHEQDTTHIIEANKRSLIESDHRAQMRNDWIRYARVPDIVIMEWKTKFGVDFFNNEHWPRVMKLINSPEYRDLKASTIYHDR